MKLNAVLRAMDQIRSTCLRNDRGAIAPMFAVLAVFLLALGALSIDLGRAYVLRADLEAAVDAAAIAAASQLDGKSDAILRARAAARGGFVENGQRAARIPETQIAIEDGAFCFMSGPQSECTQDASLAKYVRIILEPRDMDLVFGNLISTSSLQVAARATAAIALVPTAEACGEPLLVCSQQVADGFDPETHVGRALVLEPRRETGSTNVEQGQTCTQECRAVQTGQSCGEVCQPQTVPGECRWQSVPGECATEERWIYKCSGRGRNRVCGWERTDEVVCEPDTTEEICDADTTEQMCRQDCVPVYETQCETVCTPNYVTQRTFGGNYTLLTAAGSVPTSAIDIGRRDTEVCFPGSGIIADEDEDKIEELLNTRFDIYQGAARNLDNDPDFLPAINTMVGDEEDGEDVCEDLEARKPQNKQRDYDYPMAFPLDEGLDHAKGGLGDGDWSFSKYLVANHHDSSAKASDLDPFGPPPSGRSGSPTRYQVYNWEAAQIRDYYARNGPAWLQSRPGMSGDMIARAKKAFDEDQLFPDDDDDDDAYEDWEADHAPPMCNISGLSAAPPVRDRRVLRAILADCAGHGPGETITPVGTIDLFLTSPSYDGMIFTEIVGGELNNDRQVVRLVE